MNQLTIVNVGAVNTASDGRKYFGVTLNPGFGQKNVVRQMWEQFKRDPETGLPTKETYWERGNPAQAKALMEAGTPIEGRVVSHKVKPYTIPGPNGGERTSYTAVLFPGEDEVAFFANAGHNIISEEGEVLGKERAILASSTKEESKITIENKA